MKLDSPAHPEDLSFFYNLLQMNNTDAPKSHRRNLRKKDSGDGGGSDDGGSEFAVQKKRDLKGVITSLSLLDEQEREEFEEEEKAAMEERSFFETNHKKKTKAISDFYSNLDDYYTETEEIDSARRKRSRGVAAAVSGVIVSDELSEKPDKATKKRGTGGGGNIRRLWVKDRSNAWWDECNRPEYPESEFKKAFRMGKKTFDAICDELSSAIAKEDTTLRTAIPVRQRVAVCIWRLATGEPLRLVSKRFGLGISTCHKLVLEVCSAIKTVLMPKYLQWPDEETLIRVRDEFESISGIPNIVGSMYTTHVPIIAPKINVAAYFNKRHTERNQKTSYSITVQGVVDPRGVFTDVCIGWPGSMPDDQVLEKSALYQRANSGLLKGCWVAGGSGYPLMDWVLVPYTQQHLTWTQHAFNVKIGEVCRASREAFGRLKGRWSCLQRRTEVKLLDLPIVLGACCVLHNICELKGEEMSSELRVDIMDDEMVAEVGLRSASSMKARDAIAHNLLHHGLAGDSFL